jgi:ketosteroid isomerase-like protein
MAQQVIGLEPMSESELINRFYTCFQQRDYAGMQQCYSDDATFSDPVFQDLNSEEVQAMWEMLCKRGKDLELTFEILKTEESRVEAHWIALYTFSGTGRKIKNSIYATFEINDGLITAHTDHFNLHKWAGQALGFKGNLLGWTPMVQNKIRKMARGSLRKFMSGE